MYAYCGNEPIANYDPAGNYYAKVEDRITTGCGGRGGIPASIVRPSEPDLDTQPKQDTVGLIDFFTNTDENVVLEAKHFAFYNGIFIIKVPGATSFSLGVIFMGSDGDANLLNHEYGHTEQLDELGLSDYLSYVVLPSVICYWGTEWGYLPEDNYYSYPWEYQADQLGGATHKYQPWATDISDFYWKVVRG